MCYTIIIFTFPVSYYDLHLLYLFALLPLLLLVCILFACATGAQMTKETL